MKGGADGVFLFSDTIANKLHMQKVSDFVLSPGGQPSKVSNLNPPTAEREGGLDLILVPSVLFVPSR